MVVRFCCLTQARNLFTSSKHYISLPHHIFLLRSEKGSLWKRLMLSRGSRSKAVLGEPQVRQMHRMRRQRESQLHASPSLLPAEPREGFLWHLVAPQNGATQATVLARILATGQRAADSPEVKSPWWEAPVTKQRSSPALCSYPWESQEQALPRKFHTFMTFKGSKHSQYVDVLPPKSFKKVLNNK